MTFKTFIMRCQWWQQAPCLNDYSMQCIKNKAQIPVTDGQHSNGRGKEGRELFATV